MTTHNPHNQREFLPPDMARSRVTNIDGCEKLLQQHGG
jgi:hypothetical protein